MLTAAELQWTIQSFLTDNRQAGGGAGGWQVLKQSQEAGSQTLQIFTGIRASVWAQPASNKQLYRYCLWLCPHNLPASHVPARLGSGQLFSSCYKLYCCYLSVSSSVVIKQSSLHINWFVRQNSWYKQLLWQYFKENVKSEKNIDTAGVNLLIWY